jgi:cell division protein FtsB
MAVVNTLCDTKETARTQVMSLVECLATRLDQQQVECQQLREQNRELQQLNVQQEDQIAELQCCLGQKDMPAKV